MKNLIKTDFYRMSKEKSHIIVTAIMVGLTILTYALMMIVQSMTENIEGAEEFTNVIGSNFAVISFFSVMSLTALFMVISSGITIAGELKNRTISLKIIGGKSRTKIYASCVITNLSVGSAMFLLNALVCTVLSFIFFGGFDGMGGRVAAGTAMMFAVSLSIAAASYILSFALRPSLGPLINNLIVAVLPNILGVADQFLSGKAADFIFGVIPYTAINRITTAAMLDGFGTGMILQTLIGALVVFVLGLTGGWLVLRKKELT